MKLFATHVQLIQQRLRNVAEVDPNDVIANAASQLAVDLEYASLPLEVATLNPAEQTLIQYAIQKRNQYVLHPGARHAVDLERVEQPRRRLKLVDNTEK